MSYTVLVMFRDGGKWRSELSCGYQDQCSAVLAAEAPHDSPEALDISYDEAPTVLSAVFDDENGYMVYVETETRAYWPDPPSRLSPPVPPSCATGDLAGFAGKIIATKL